jgi:hypothetical protein
MFLSELYQYVHTSKQSGQPTGASSPDDAEQTAE